MRHLIKYRFMEIVREWSIMFWALAFPIILGTFFYISFGSGKDIEIMKEIPVAVVVEDNKTETAEAFEVFLKEMDSDVLKTKFMKEEKALKLLNGDEVEGIYYVKEEPSLTVAKSDINQSVLKFVLDNFNQNAAMITKIANTHPERMQQAMGQLNEWEEMTKEVGMGGKETDPNIIYFYTLIAYACLSGVFIGLKSSIDTQANLSALGARRSVTATPKIKLILSDMIVLFTIHFVDIVIVTLYVWLVLGINMGDNPIKVLLVDLMGSIIGVSMGILIGCMGRFTVQTKMGIGVLMTLLPGFLAGLMIGNMKDIIEHNMPIINRINPAAVISDAFYCMGIYDNPERFTRNLLILGGMSIVFCVAAFFRVRRERYDSI